MPKLTDKQRQFLLKPINQARVKQDNSGHSNIAAWDVEAYLTRFFGIEGWDREIVELWVIHETCALDPKRNRDGWTVTYGCRLRLTIRNPDGEIVKITDGCATGSANNLESRGDAHDFAMKNADSYALKRCAKALGDQFGLSLYNKGSLDPVVRESLAYETLNASQLLVYASGGNAEAAVDHQRDVEGGPENWPELNRSEREKKAAEEVKQARLNLQEAVRST